MAEMVYNGVKYELSEEEKKIVDMIVVRKKARQYVDKFYITEYQPKTPKLADKKFKTSTTYEFVLDHAKKNLEEHIEVEEVFRHLSMKMPVILVEDKVYLGLRFKG